jgi:hypothetical protein
MGGYWFTSSLFTLEPGEDKEVNPGRYGRQLAIWLKKQLEERGYAVEPIINEDWGRCLMCSRDPFMLWVGCANMMDPEPFGQARHEGAIVWHCFTTAEVPFWQRLLHPFRRLNTIAAVSRLDTDLGEILSECPDIEMVDEP